MDDDATLPAVPPTPYVGGSASSETAPTNPLGKQPGVHAELERYDLGAVLGRGGMGEVRLAKDSRIEREVAVKLMRGDRADPETIARFFREAKVQGALEHPAVVPVHDLGIDANGNPFFVMKRLAGHTLADVLRDPQWPRRKLLGRFVDVCMAVAFAHERGVVHRDLKPSNIMLGDFGEAYVLDWGLAKIRDDDSLTGVVTISGDDAHTQVGALLGTPGYLAPEQARGEPVDDRADVYGLGCVLYEILVGKPALPRGMAAVAEALVIEALRPSAAATDIPPELDELCARATAQQRRDRPSARELADGIQAYLDGDRDLNARRELAEAHAARARDRLAAGSDDDARAEAMREAGRALALDANNALAQSVMSRLLIEGPDIIPADAKAAADAERASARMKTMRWASGAYFGLAAAGLVLFFLPIREVWLVALAISMCSVLGAFSVYLSRKPLPMRSRWLLVFVGMNSVLLLLASMLFGPLFLTPILLAGSYAAFLVQPTTFHPWIVFVGHVAPVTLAIVLELVGVFPSSFHVEGGSLLLRPWVLELTPLTAWILMLLTIGIQLVNNTIILLPHRREQEQAQDRLHAQRWHLGKLLPTDADLPKR